MNYNSRTGLVFKFQVPKVVKVAAPAAAPQQPIHKCKLSRLNQYAVDQLEDQKAALEVARQSLHKCKLSRLAEGRLGKK